MDAVIEEAVMEEAPATSPNAAYYDSFNNKLHLSSTEQRDYLTRSNMFL